MVASIEVYQGENAEPEPTGHELVTRDASAAFGQVGVWKIADDASGMHAMTNHMEARRIDGIYFEHAVLRVTAAHGGRLGVYV